MPGFFRRTQKINVDPGFRVNAAFKLAIDQSSSFAKEPDDKTKAASSSASADNKTYVNNTRQSSRLAKSQSRWCN